MSKEHKIKIGEANKKGKFIKCLECRKDFWITPFEEKRNPPRKYCNIKCFKKYFSKHFAKKSSENHFWKGGEWSFIKRSVLKRDNFTCCECGFSNKNIMHVHHIVERMNGGKDTMENAQTLCPNCHAVKTLPIWKRKRNK